MVLAFDDFELDTAKVELRKDGQPVAIEPQVFALICLLVENHDRVVSKDELVEKIWSGRFISDAAIASRISLARKALGDDGKRQRLLKTIHGLGVRFVGSVTDVGDPNSDPDIPATEADTGPSQIMIASETLQRREASIAVLPFDNMNDEREYEYLVDGIVEDITTSLAKAGWLFVMSRNSSFTYKERFVDVTQVGRELGVRYVLEGSIRRSRSSLRVTAQLIETRTGGHIWAEKYDGTVDEIFELQDKITEHVVGAIEPGVRKAETLRAYAKPTTNLDAYDLYLRGVHQMYASTKNSFDSAVEFLKAAIETDPDFQLAKAFLALTLAMQDTPGWSRAGDAGKAIALAREAIVDANDNPVILRAAGYALAYFAEKKSRSAGDDLDVATEALERALDLHPTSAQTLNSLGFARLWSGDTEQAIECFNRAIEISPRDQEMGYILVGLATAHLILGRDNDALETAKRSIAEMPNNGSGHRILIVALFRLDRLSEAKMALKRLLNILPDAKLSDVKPLSKPFGFADRFLTDLRTVGYPE